jgi:hypothetical protein
LYQAFSRPKHNLAIVVFMPLGNILGPYSFKMPLLWGDRFKPDRHSLGIKVPAIMRAAGGAFCGFGGALQRPIIA